MKPRIGRRIAFAIAAICLGLATPNAGMAGNGTSRFLVSFTCSDATGSAHYVVTAFGATLSFTLRQKACVAPSGTFTSVSELIAFIRSLG